MRKLLTICGILLTLTASAQWQQTGAKVRYVTGIGIPTKDTAAGVSADSSQILIRPADSALYVKYKRTWLKVGGTAFTGTGTINYIPKFTSSSSFGNSRIIDDGSLFLMGFTSSQTGIASLQVNGGIYSSSSGYPMTFNSSANTSFNPFYFSTSNLFGAIGNYSGLIAGGPAANDSMLTFLGMSSLTFASNGGTERLRITRGGQLNVGGNFTSTNNTLQVTGNAAIGYTAAAPTNGLIVNGNTGMGTTAPSNSYKLSLNGDATVTTGGIECRQNGTATFYMGNPLVTNTTDFELWNPRNGYLRFGTNNVDRLYITSTGNILAGTSTDNGTDKLQVNGSTISTQYKLSSLNTAPATSSSTGTTGEIRIDANYIYICTATNTWKRVAIATW